MAARSPQHAQFALGVDYGTNSVRTLVVDVADGREVASAVSEYPSGEAGILLDPKEPNLARQNPQDYIDGFFDSVSKAVAAARRDRRFRPEAVVGIGIDTTGSTPLPVDAEGMPLALQPAFKRNLAAQAWLWKDHTSHAEAAEISDKARRHRDGYLAKCGGVYSSEWYWSKVLHCKRTAPKVFAAAVSWVELADFVPGFITGNLRPDSLPRSICAAGHKAMYHEQWKGLPSKSFLKSLDADLPRLVDSFAAPALTSDRRAGLLTPQVAREVGLPAGLPVAVGAFDAHMGAVGAGCSAGKLAKILGTSTCDLMVAKNTIPLQDIPGVCGLVDGSVIAGYTGIEAGQSAVGDIFLWFVNNLVPESFGKSTDAKFPALDAAASRLKPGESGLLALDWNNGNRCVLTDVRLSGLVLGQTLHTSAPELYRALVEATAFGAKMITDRVREYGVPVEEVIACGGLAVKSPFLMQIYADILNMPMAVAASDQTCALGAALFGAVAAGAFPDIEAAQAKVCRLREKVYQPIPENAAVYAELFALYRQLHDGFGTAAWSGGMANVMKQLIAIREKQR